MAFLLCFLKLPDITDALYKGLKIMFEKLPKWVELGGFALAFLAGMVNAVGLLGFEHQAISHLTGVSSMIGVEIIMQRWQVLLHLIMILISFVIGAAFSGFMLPQVALVWGQRYGLALKIQALFLVLSSLLLSKDYSVGHFLASAACGLQNGLATNYSGATVRTTHLSGMYTDIGVLLGARLRGVKLDTRRLLLYLTIIVGFIIGGVLGAYLFQKIAYFTLLLAGLLCLALSFGYEIGSFLYKPKKLQNEK